MEYQILFLLIDLKTDNMAYKYWMAILLLALVTSTVSSFELNKEITGIRRLKKRECDFTCRNANNCESLCMNSGETEVLLLSVCHDGKCYCGFMPSE